MSFSPPDSHVSVAALVQRIARELVAARDHLHHVELALDHAPGVPGRDGAADAPGMLPLSHIARLQSLDLVMQLLAELSGCLDRLSQEPTVLEAGPVDARDVLRGLRLADLQRRLGNLAETAPTEIRVELF